MKSRTVVVAAVALGLASASAFAQDKKTVLNLETAFMALTKGITS